MTPLFRDQPILIGIWESRHDGIAVTLREDFSTLCFYPFVPTVVIAFLALLLNERGQDLQGL
jgi:hypothetical protein